MLVCKKNSCIISASWDTKIEDHVPDCLLFYFSGTSNECAHIAFLHFCPHNMTTCNLCK